MKIKKMYLLMRIGVMSLSCLSVIGCGGGGNASGGGSGNINPNPPPDNASGGAGGNINSNPPPDTEPPPISATVPPEISSISFSEASQHGFYLPGPAYAAILIHNKDLKHPLFFDSGSHGSTDIVQILDRLAPPGSKDPLYGDYPKCPIDIGAKLSLQPNASCLVIAKANPKVPGNWYPNSASFSLGSQNVFSVDVYFTNTTLMYADNDGKTGIYEYSGKDQAKDASWQVINGSPSYITALVSDAAGNIYTGNDTGVQQYNGTSWNTYGTLKVSNPVKALAFDNDNNTLYAGGSTQEQGFFSKFTPATDQDNWINISNDPVTLLATSGNHYIDLGTDNEIKQYDLKQVNHLFAMPAGTTLTALVDNHEGSIYYGLSDGEVYLEHGGNSQRQYSLEQATPVTAIAINPKNKHIFSSTSSGVFDDGKKLPDTPANVTTLLFDNGGNLYAAATGCTAVPSDNNASSSCVYKWDGKWTKLGSAPGMTKITNLVLGSTITTEIIKQEK